MSDVIAVTVRHVLSRGEPEQVNKKMAKRPDKRNAPWIREINGLRLSLGAISQQGLADRLRVRPSTVSAWMKGVPPSAEAYIALAKLASYPRCLWFWKQALGGNMDSLLAMAERVLAARGGPPAPCEVLRVQLIHQLGHDSSARTETLALPAKYLPSSQLGSSLRAVPAPRDSVRPFKKGDIILFVETPETGLSLGLALGDLPGDGPVDEAIIAELFGNIVVAYHAKGGDQCVRRLYYYGTSVVLAGDDDPVPIAITGDPDWRVMGRVIGWLAQPGRKRKTRNGKRSQGGRRKKATRR